MTFDPTIVARYPGTCADCGQPIEPGQRIAAQLGADLRNEWRHVTPPCPPTKAERADAAALAQPRCGCCGLNHPGEC